MITWLFNLIFGNFCRHDYRIVRHGAIHVEGSKVGDYYNCRCVKCGHMKQFNLD